MKKRMLSLLLAAMVVTMLPVTAWAEEVSPIQDSGEASVPVLGERIEADSNSGKLTVSENTLSGSVSSVTGSGSRSTLASAQFTTEAATPLLLSAGRAAGTTPYVDEHGVEHTETATEITSATTGLDDTTTGGWYVVSGNVSTGTLTVNGDVKLILADGASLTVTGSGTKAGVLVDEGNSLTIYSQIMGTGRLDAVGGDSGAGIGTDKDGAFSAGIVNIYGGTVIARSGGGVYGSAGIGGGYDSNGGTVNIYGGSVTATGEKSGAGIGGGSVGSCGSVNIYGGTVTASGGTYGAGIGGGYLGNVYGSDCTVNIYGGTVKATGGATGAGIGGGYHGNGGSVNIHGGLVEATGGTYGAGIGAGQGGNGGSVNITGGTVTAAGGTDSVDIGGKSGTISITGGDVTASRFSSSDTAVPTVQSVSPDGVNVALSGYIVITFSETMMPPVGIISLDNGVGALTGGSWDTDRKVYTVTYSGLTRSTEYIISISGFYDAAGNAMTADASHSFTTEPEPDMINPIVANVTPSGADTAISGNITVTFSEAMNTSAGTVSLDGGVTSLTGGSWTVGNTVYTVPYSLLGYGTAYTLSISGFRDAAGNPMTADTSHRFTTMTEPLTPSVSVNTLTVSQGGTANFTVSLGQGATAATRADITVTNSSIASVSTGRLTASGAITVTGLSEGSTSITVTFNDFARTVKTIAVTVNPAFNGSNPSSGNSDSGSSSGSSSVTSEKQPDYPVTVEIFVTATADKNDHATATIPESAIAEAIKKAAAAAKSQDKTENGIGISVTVNTPANTKSLGLVLSQSVLKQLAEAKVRQFEINGQRLTLNLDQEAIRQLLSQSTGDVTITIKPVTVVGVRNAYEITFTTVKNGKTVTISSLGDGSATLSIPCTPAKNEAAGYLYAVYVDAKGRYNRIPGSAYDANSRSMIFSTSHFSVYGVSYKAPSAKFTDIDTNWAKDSIDFVVGRGLLSGTSKTTFAPDNAMTRGTLVTALGRLAGADAKAYTTNSFTDVKADSPFRPYIEWAYSKGIIQGIGNGQFAPDRAITREEIAIIFANYARATGYKLPVTRTTAAFADASSIGSTYKDSVTAMQQAGIIMGETNNKFNPKYNATRVEVSAMLHRYIKLIINPATAQGWVKDDDGQYMYYKDGNALTGMQAINGVKYFFCIDGTLETGWVKDGLMVAGKWMELDSK